MPAPSANTSGFARRTVSHSNAPYSAPTTVTCSTDSGWPATISSTNAMVSSAAFSSCTSRRVANSTSGR
jgi:hypothetical protein